MGDHPEFDLTAGGRWDHYQLAGNAFTYRFSGAYLIDATKTKLRASYGTAFKAPDLFDTFSTAAFALGNRGLRPETSRGYDVGFDQYLWDSGVTFSASFFQNYIHAVEDFSFFPAKNVRLNDYWVLRTYAVASERPSRVHFQSREFVRSALLHHYWISGARDRRVRRS